MVTLDIFSDPICPWCHIGKANLDRALAQAPENPFVIAWHPFQLNPDMPPQGADRRSHLAARLGGADRLAQAESRLVEQAAQAGAVIDLDALTRIPNTLDAHRLIHWAGIELRQDAVVTALFHTYFAEGRDIGNPEVLCDIADGAGLDAAVIGRLLASDADKDAIRARDAHARKMGIDAVPTHIIGNRHAVPGAQSADLWARVIAELAAQAPIAGQTGAA